MKEAAEYKVKEENLASTTQGVFPRGISKPRFVLTFLFGLLVLSTVLIKSDSSVRPAGSVSALDLNSAEAATFDFLKMYVDTNYGASGKPGWARAGDMDNDGDIDIVAGGGRGLFIYKNNGSAGGWQRYGNLDGSAKMGANGAVLYDVDKDGDLDVVTAKYYAKLGWWKNPGGALTNSTWNFIPFSTETYYLHDIIVVDLDKDGKAEEFVTVLNTGYWTAQIKIKWFRPGADPKEYWESHTIESGRGETAHGHAGLDVGDIDNDGHVDVGFSNGWYEAPDDPTGSGWTWRQVTDIYGISNTGVQDMDGDNNLDLVVSGGHHGQGVFWLENDGSPKSGAWPQHNITPVTGNVTQRHYYSASAPDHVHHPECLGLADMDGDNDTDVVTCDLYFGEDPGEPPWHQEAANVYIFENQGNSLSWTKHNIVPNSYPSHMLQLVDINDDNLLDIIGEGSGNGNVNYFENQTGGVVPPTNTPTSTPKPPEVDSDSIYVSSSSGGTVSGISFADEDILAYDTTSGDWAMYLDGSDVGLSGSTSRDTDAFHIFDDGRIILSVVGATSLPDVGSVDDSDIVLFTPTSLGTNTSGTYSRYFDGSDVGLTVDGEDIDALTVLENGDLLISTSGGWSAGGLSGGDEDLIRFAPSSLGSNTSGTWSYYFDGSDVGLTTLTEDTWGVSVNNAEGDLYLTTKGNFSVSGASGDGADILRCVPSSLGSNTACAFNLAWDGSANGIGGEYLDGLALYATSGGGPTPTPTATPTPPPSGGDGFVYASSSTDGNAGGVTFDDEDIIVLNTSTGNWAMHFDGSDVGLGASDVDAFHFLQDGSILISLVADTTLPVLGSVDDSDIIQFLPTSLGDNTTGTFTLYFDGSDVDLTTSGDDIDALYVLANGDLLMSTSGGETAGGVSFKDEDLILFSPTSLGPTTSGSWSLYFDGSDVGLNTLISEDTWGVWLDESNGDIYFTPKDVFAVAGVSGDGADIVICHPTSLGSNTACSFSLGLDGSSYGIAGEYLDGLLLDP